MVLSLTFPFRPFSTKRKEGTRHSEGHQRRHLRRNIYKKIYPSGSNPGKFYGTAKIHKISNEEEMNIGNVDRLPLRPIVSNIDTATYKTSKFLAELLAPLGKSKYTVSSTKEFITKIKDIVPPEGYQMISFDVVSLFTNVPLEKTVDIIINKVYKEKKIKTKIKADKLRELL